MPTARRAITAYYNVDGNYWCDANGNYANPSQTPRFTLHEQAVLLLTLVHNFGEEVTDLIPELAFRFSVFSDTGVRLIDTDNSNINSAEALEYWEDATSAEGKFAILINADTTPLKTALEGFVCKWFSVEFNSFELLGLVGSYKEHLFCMNSNMDSDDINDGVVQSVITQGQVTIEANSVFTLIEADSSKYNLLAPTIETPTGAEINYGVTTVEVTDTGFKVFYNATVSESGYVLRYTLIRKV